MKSLVLAALLIPFAALGGWVPASNRVPASNWWALASAIQARGEATYYGASYVTNAGIITTNRLYLADASPVVTEALLSLGTYARQMVEWDFWDDEWRMVGPVICETNISAGVTNVWCWTNHVALDTGYYTSTNGDTFYQPYGPQLATNFVWMAGDPRLSEFDLPGQIFLEPTPSAVRAMDNRIKDMIPLYADWVALQEAGGVAAWFAQPRVTNWAWVDSDGDHVDDKWEPYVTRPVQLPYLSVSNAWRRAGIEPYQYPAAIETVSVERLGFEVDRVDEFQVSVNEIRTNWVRRYDFTRSPTSFPWRASIAQLWIVPTNTVSTYGTNGNHLATNILDGRLLEVRYQLGSYLQSVNELAYNTITPRLLGLTEIPTNTIVLTPPMTGDVAALFHGLILSVTGTAIVVTNGLWVPDFSFASTQHLSAFNWHSGHAEVDTGCTLRRVAFAELLGLSGREEIHSWTNGFAYSNSIMGTVIDFTVSGSSYELGQFGWWEVTAADYAERRAVLDQLRVTFSDVPFFTARWDGWDRDLYNGYSYPPAPQTSAYLSVASASSTCIDGYEGYSSSTSSGSFGFAPRLDLPQYTPGKLRSTTAEHYVGWALNSGGLAYRLNEQESSGHTRWVRDYFPYNDTCESDSTSVVSRKWLYITTRCCYAYVHEPTY